MATAEAQHRRPNRAESLGPARGPWAARLTGARVPGLPVACTMTLVKHGVRYLRAGLRVPDVVGTRYAGLPSRGHPDARGWRKEAGQPASQERRAPVPELGLCPQTPSSFPVAVGPDRMLLAAGNRFLSEIDLINTGVYCLTRIWRMRGLGAMI